MEKTNIYFISSDDKGVMSVEKIDSFVFINPLTGIKTWLVKDEECARAYYESEFEENDYYLTEKEALSVIEERKNNDIYFLKLCIEFSDACDKHYNGRNPFVEIGEQEIIRNNEYFVKNISDPFYKYYAERNLCSIGHLSDLHKKILSEVNKK